MAWWSSGPSVPMLGSWLVATLAVAYLFLGGVRPAAQATLHVMVAVGAVLAARLPAERLTHAGVTLRWAVAGVFLVAALAVGLVPVPRAVAAWVAPGLLGARPDAGWTSLSVDAGAVVGEICTFLLVIGFGALVTAWGAARQRRGALLDVLTAATGVLAASALLHAASGATAMLGAITPEFVPSPFFAPFVNPHHASAVMLLGGPVAAGLALAPRVPPWKRGLAACVAALALTQVSWARSNGALAVAGLVAGLSLLRLRASVPLRALLVLVALAAGVQLWAGAAAAGDGSLTTRADLWRDTLRMAGDFWLAGTGGGTFGEAIRAYRSDGTHLAFAHAHNDPLEWFAETGVVGVAAAALALAIAWPGRLRPGRQGAGPATGLLALGLHAFVDFPLQIPAVAMSAAGVGAGLVAVFGCRLPAAGPVVRTVILGVGLLQLPAAAWRARDALAARAVAGVHAFRADPERAAQGAQRLEALRASGPERLLFTAWSAERRADSTAAVAAALSVLDRFPHDPDALREGALVLARAGHHEEAVAALRRVTERDRADYRPWVLLARIAHARGDDRLAAEHWTAAFRRSAPGFQEAWALFPVGLYWLQAFGEADARYSAELASQLWHEREDLEVALLACAQAARLDPVVYADLLVRSPILVALGRAPEAKAWLEEVISRRPQDPRALEEYGSVLDALGRHEEAIDAYLRGARAAPALRVRALNSAEAAGGPERALALGRRFELDGDLDPALGFELARVRMRMGDPTGCLLEIERHRLTTSAVGTSALELLETCRWMDP